MPGVESDTPTPAEPAGRTRTTIVGTLVAVYPVVDGYLLGIPVVVLAATTRPLVVFAVAAVLFTLINLACCRWVNTHWTQFVAGSGARIEKQLEKARAGRRMGRVVGWIEHGSDKHFALASMLLNAVWVVAFARILGGKRVGDRRILIASVAYGVGAAGMESLLGWVVGGLIRFAM